MGAGLVHELEQTGHKGIVCGTGNDFVKHAIPDLELFNTDRRFGVCAAIVHLLKIGQGSVANHHLDDGGFQGHARLHEFGRTGVPGGIGRINRRGLFRTDSDHRLVGDISATAHGLGDQPLGLHVGQHLAHSAAADLVLLTKRTLGRQALTGLPLAAVQLVKQGGAKEVRGVHVVG